jgi:hypothetical protein
VAVQHLFEDREQFQDAGELLPAGLRDKDVSLKPAVWRPGDIEDESHALRSSALPGPEAGRENLMLAQVMQPVTRPASGKYLGSSPVKKAPGAALRRSERAWRAYPGRQFVPAVDAEFGEDMRQVILDGLRAQVQLGGNVAVGEPGGYQPRDSRFLPG